MKYDVVALGDICDFIYGDGLKESDRKGGNVPVYGSNGIVGWHDKPLTKGETIIVGRKGSIGEVHLSKVSCWPIDTTYYIEKTKVPCDFTWLYYMLLALDLTRLNKSAAVPGLNRDDAYEQKLPLPPLPEQRRIAGLLARADRLRRLRRVGDSLSASLLPSVFLEMFGDLLNDNIKTKFSDVLEIPLTNGFFEKNDKYGEGTPIVWVDNLYHTNFIDISELRRVRTSKSAIAKYEVIEGDLLFTRSSLVDEGVGQVNIMPMPLEKTMFESHVIRARVDKKRVNPIFIHALYRSQFAKSEIMRRAKTATMTTIGQDTIYELSCPIPPLPRQEQFAAVVRRVESLRARAGESARQVEGLFQSLLALSFGEGLSQSFGDKHA